MFAALTRRRSHTRDNETTQISVLDWAKMFKPGQTVSFAGNTYQAFTSAASGAAFYDTNAVVFACEANRLLLFSEARFQYQEMRRGRPGNLFGTETLGILEEPWVGASTRDLLAQAELDVFAAGNSYWTLDAQGRYLVRLDPCKMKIITAGAYDPMTGRVMAEQLVAYAFVREHGAQPVVFEPREVAHYKPYPDESNRFVGKSWLSACIPDVNADQALTSHKTTATQTGAQLGYVVTLDKEVTPDDFDYFVEKFREGHEGPQNAGKTLFIGGGADVKTVGQSFEQLQYKALQGAGETRVAACSGVPPVIVGLSEGLSSATYSNYSQARRRLVDGTMRPLWGFFAAALESIIPVPSGARLFYDDRDIPFLREDVQDQAEIIAKNASAIVTLINGGFDPDASVDAVGASDINRLVGKHTGLVSVQLQPPGSALPGHEAPSAPALPAGNGNGNGQNPPAVQQPPAQAAVNAPRTPPRTPNGTARRAKRTKAEREQDVRRIEAARKGVAVHTRYAPVDGVDTEAEPDHERDASTPGADDAD